MTKTILHKTVDQPLTLRQIAVEEFNLANGDRPAAIESMVERLFGDDCLRSVLAEPIVRNACAVEIGDIIRGQRAKDWRSEEKHQTQTPEAGRRQVAAIAAFNRRTLMDFRLPSGVRLADATGAQVREASNFYLTRGRNEMVKGKWLASIADVVPADRKVGKLLNLKKISDLQVKAEAS